MLYLEEKPHLAGGAETAYLWGMAREKLNIRLPTDTGPNPYDSKTDPKALTPKWLTGGWWFSVIAGGIGIAAARYYSNGGHF